MPESIEDYADIVRTAEAILDGWCDKFRTNVPPDLETVCFWLETTPPELVLRGIEHAYASRVPNTYMLAHLVKVVDDYIARSPQAQVASGSALTDYWISPILGGEI